MDQRLINYLYFLKDDAESLTAFREQVLGALDVSSSGSGAFLSAEQESATVVATKDFGDAHLEVFLSILSDVSVLGMIWTGSPSQYLPSFEEGTALAELLGDATVFVGGCPTRAAHVDRAAAPPAMVAAGTAGGFEAAVPAATASDALRDAIFERRQKYLCEECGLRGESLMLSGPFGSLCHMPPGDGEKSHYYLLSPSNDLSEALLRQIITYRIPALDMVIRRLRKKQTLFSDRRRAIESEHRAMDGAVGRFFHREAASHDEDSKVRGDRLAAEITRLSQIYAVLATDAQLVKDAEASFREELDALHRCAANIAGHSGSLESTLVMYYDGRFGPELKALGDQSSALSLSLERVGAAVDIVRTEVELLRGSEAMQIQEQTKELLQHNVALQQERMALLIAANVIEFVVIFYYSLSSWDAIVGLEAMEHIPALIRFGSVAFFAGAAVGLTHMIAKSLRQHRPAVIGLILSTVAVLAALGLMALATLMYT